MVKSLATSVKSRAHKTYDIFKVKQRHVQSAFCNRQVKVKHSQQQGIGNSDCKLRWPQREVLKEDSGSNGKNKGTNYF